jgi:DNA-binding transcriptional LysR family regulator
MNAESASATDIELRVWRQFLAVAEMLHFGRAAQALHMTQPPLTQAIQQLERRLGVMLFERTRRSVALTPAGAALVEPARQLLQQAAALPGRARDAAQGEVGRLRLGFVSTIAFGPLPLWLRAFREAQPGITIDLREATGDVQLEAFAQQELDAGFVLHAPGIALPPTLQRLSLGVEPLVLALPESTPKRLSAASLLREPLVIFPRAIAPSLYDAVLAFYHRHGVTPVIAQEAIQMQTIVNLVSAGLGLALVPQAMRSLQRPGIVYRALPAALADGAPRAETSLVWRPDAAPVVQRFVRFVEAHR